MSSRPCPQCGKMFEMSLGLVTCPHCQYQFCLQDRAGGEQIMQQPTEPTSIESADAIAALKNACSGL